MRGTTEEKVQRARRSFTIGPLAGRRSRKCASRMTIFTYLNSFRTRARRESPWGRQWSKISRIPSDWGLEKIRRAFRSLAQSIDPSAICQVEIADNYYFTSINRFRMGQSGSRPGQNAAIDIHQIDLPQACEVDSFFTKARSGRQATYFRIRTGTGFETSTMMR